MSARACTRSSLVRSCGPQVQKAGACVMQTCGDHDGQGGDFPCASASLRVDLAAAYSTDVRGESAEGACSCYSGSRVRIQQL